MNFAFITRPTGGLELDPEMFADLVQAAFEMQTVSSTKVGFQTEMMNVVMTRQERKVTVPEGPVRGFRFDFNADDGIGVLKSTGAFAFFESTMPQRFEVLDFFSNLLKK